MHDIWNPWHGCTKYSEGCLNCYMYYLDTVHNNTDPSIVRKTQSFDYPLSKNRDGTYKIKPGETIRVCMNSDFFVEEADKWRDEAWKIIKKRSDVKFFILTKRAERIKDCLPFDWGDGYDNVMMNVTCENQTRVDERIPILLDLKAKHKGIMCAPILGSITIEKYLQYGKLEQVLCDGENYSGARICKYEWVKNLSEECKKYNVTFVFCSIGNNFEKDGKIYRLSGDIQRKMAYKSGLSYKGKDAVYNLTFSDGIEIPKEMLYVPFFRDKCNECSMKISCNGCSNCGKCK